MADATNAKPIRVNRKILTISLNLKKMCKRNRHKPQNQPNTDEGNYIILINAKKIKVTGNKLSDKIYYKHTGYIGNMKETPLGKMLDKKPDFVIKNAVKGMLPKNPLGRSMIKKLKIYESDTHGHGAQKPTALEV